MSNLTKYLVIVGIMIAVGGIMSFGGSQLTMDDFVVKDGKINQITELVVKTELNPDINTQATIVIQTFCEEEKIKNEECNVLGKVMDPSGIKIREISANTKSIQDTFDINTPGEYTLIISTLDLEEILVAGAIGHPDPDVTGGMISLVGVFIILIGMIGIVVIGFMAVRQKKNKSS